MMSHGWGYALLKDGGFGSSFGKKEERRYRDPKLEVVIGLLLLLLLPIGPTDPPQKMEVHTRRVLFEQDPELFGV